jgi:hypothetical protein
MSTTPSSFASAKNVLPRCGSPLAIALAQLPLWEARKWAERALMDNSAYVPVLRTMAAIEAASGNLERAK